MMSEQNRIDFYLHKTCLIRVQISIGLKETTNQCNTAKCLMTLKSS